MEYIGLIFGVAGLPGAFTACIDCFEYVQLGRQFGRDYSKCLLRLDAAKLRMSRWGAAVGLSQASDRRNELPMSDQEKKTARNLLEQIFDSFADAESISERFKKYATTKGTRSHELRVYNTDCDLDSDFRGLHVTMRELASQRQKGTSLRKKAAWALYEKKRFDRLIEDVTDFVSQLIELFPAAYEDQRGFCRAEVAAVNGTQLALLEEIVGEDDTLLAAEVRKELDSRGHTFTDWKAGGYSKMWAGDENSFGIESKGHTFARFTVTDSADVHLGNRNRGR